MNQALCQLSYLGGSPGRSLAGPGRVGNHGIGPCRYRLIRAASSPAESLPLSMAWLRSPRRTENSNPCGCPLIRLRTGGRALAASSSMRGRYTDRTCAGLPSRPPASNRAPCLSANLPGAEGGLLESHALQRASASNGARHACPVHPPWCRPRDSDPEPLRSGRSASASWARAAWSG
jgi:hypothetical protein